MAKKSDNTADNKKVLVTKKGFQKLQEELKHLKEVRRKEVAARLAEAISYGDLSENSEYDEAKNEQSFVEFRISELEEQIKYAEIIEKSKGGSDTVKIGSTVTLRLEKTGDENEYTIVGSTEADPMMHKLSNESPVGEAILGKKTKEKVSVQAPGGIYVYEIMNVV